MFRLVTRRRYEEDLAAAKAETDRQRKRAITAAEASVTAEFNRGQVLRLNAELDAANRRLAGRNLALGERISKLTEADPEYAAALERRVARLRTVGRRILAAYGAELKRATHLQARLDDACSLDDPAVTAGRHWQSVRQDKKGLVS